MSEDILTIRYVPLATVALWERNPKLHHIGDLAASIERYGFKESPRYEPTLNDGQGGIVAGNGRIETLDALWRQNKPAPRGIVVQDDQWLVPITFGVDAESQEAAEAYGIDANNLTLSGGDFTAFDMARLWGDGYTDILSSLALSSSLPITVDGDALDGLLAAMIPEPEAQPGDDEGPSPDTPTRVQPGDVWKVGGHIVACLDSTDRALVERWVDQATFVVADPPYGVKAVGKDGRIGSDYSDNKTPGYERFKGYSANVYAPVIGDETTDTAVDAALLMLDLFPKAVQVWWGANYYAQALPPSPCWIVWDKENDGDDFPDAELAWVNHKSAVRIFRHMWKGMLRASEVHDKRVHPTQKPVALFLWLYERYGKAGDVIFDPFLGSGPSLKAAHRMGDRTVIGFELSPSYCDHILDWAASNGLPCERAE